MNPLHPPRLTLDPALPDDERTQRQDRYRAAFGVDPDATWDNAVSHAVHKFRWIFVGVCGFMVFVGSLASLTADPSLIPFLILGIGLVGLTAVGFRKKRSMLGRRDAHRDGGRTIDPQYLHPHEYLRLLRLQRAVDTIINSRVQHLDLAGDATQTRIVLNDVEWNAARQLARHSQRRTQIESVDTPGERSRIAAQDALNKLAADQAPVMRHIVEIEEYARQVRRVDQEYADAIAARQIEALHQDDPRDDAAALANTQSLESLRDAQQTLKRIAAEGS